jgi:hypothetical protein
MKIIRDVARQSHSLDRLYSFESSFAPSRRVIVRVVYTIDKPEDESRIMIPYHFGGQFFQTSGDAESEPKIEEIGFDFQFRSRVPLNIYVGYLGSGQTLKLVGRQRPLAPKKTSLAVNGHSVVYSASFCGRPLPRLTVKLFDVRPRGQLSFIGFRTGCATDEQHRCNGDLLNPGANASACWNSLNRYYSGGHGTITRLTKCFPPVYLRNFILASYGYNFTEEQWRHEFYDSGLFLPSTTPFEDSWLTPGDRAAIERLKKLEAQAATPPTPGAH